MAEILPASTYNSLPEGDALQSPSPQTLEQLGDIIIAHGMQDQLGIGLLHRHFELVPGEVMLHEKLRCSPKLAIGEPALHGSTFFLKDGQFQAFEYDTTDPVPLCETFIDDMASFLCKNNLTKEISLSKLGQGYSLLGESLDDDRRAHICTEVSATMCLSPDEATVWRFNLSSNGHARPFITRICKKSSTGAHKRTK